MIILKNTEAKGIYDYGNYVPDEKAKYIMVFSEKPDKYYEAEVKLTGWCGWTEGRDFYLNNHCRVQITVCGKKQKAVRPDTIYLFDSVEEYKDWFNKKQEKYNNYKMTDKLFCDALFDALGFHRVDGDDNFWNTLSKSDLWKQTAKEDSKEESGENDIDIAGSISIHLQNTNFEGDIWLSHKNDKYFIDGINVDKKTYDDAIAVVRGDGTVDHIINSVKDILNEYETTKKQKREAEINAKREALTKKIAELQAELEQYK